MGQSPRMPVLPAIVGLCCILSLMTTAAGQGLRPSATRTLGASETLAQLQLTYISSRNFIRNYKLSPKSACSKGSRGSLCAAAGADAVDAYAQLMLATSPQAYSSLNPQYAGSARLVAPPGDQQACQTCVAFAVTAAAETAMASALRVNVQRCSISVQAFYFCPVGGGPVRSCDAGWTLQEAITLLEQRGSSLPAADCLPYKPDFRGDLSRSEMCTGICSGPNEFADQGYFSSKSITNPWRAQAHIREHGSVVASFDVYSDLRAFFDNYGNAQAIYRPGKDAKFEYAHAVTLVGYNNEQQYWLVKNSWGAAWADNGYFKVAYGACGVLTDKGEAYGVIWTPNTRPAELQLPVTPAATAGCFLYQARPGDYLSRVAWLAGIPLDKFLLDNTGTIKDLDAPLAGKQLLLCNPDSGTYVVLKSSASSTASAANKVAPDTQLEALLRIKAAIDTTGVLQGWNRAAGANGGYCQWRSVDCAEGTEVVEKINIWYGTGVQGLKGTLPAAAAFDGLVGLREIGIGDQPGITGTVPSDWSQLQQLVDVRLGNNSLTGSLPHSWSSMRQLKVLYLFRNKLTGRLPDSWKDMATMENLRLSTNSLTGSLPPSWSSMRQLKVLYLGFNKLSGRLPNNWKDMTAMEELIIQANSFTGTLPPSWLSMRQLKELYLDTNSLTGSLPQSWSSMQKLKELSLTTNKLSGSLPDSWRDMTAMEDMRIAINSLTGSLPPSWSSMRHVKALYLGSNKLSGKLPDSWKGLTAMEELSLSDNALVGSVPASWASMTRLKKVYLWGNTLLGGCLSQPWQKLLLAAKFDIKEYILDQTRINGFC